MLGEPTPTQADIHFRLFGIPVRIHPLFWLVTALLGANSAGVRELFTWIAAVFVVILIHEIGHALVIQAYGCHPWIVLYGLGGITAHDPAENYRSKAATPLGQITISLAGPFSGFLLAAILVAALYLAGFKKDVYFLPIIDGWKSNLQPIWLEPTLLAMLVNRIFFVSVFWGLVNLLPIYHLDGGQIAREILHYFNPQSGISQSLMLSIVIAILFAIYGLFQLQSWFVCLFFGFLAYESFTAFQAYSQGGRW
jgi:stage IV sporulation protein FB